MRLLAALALLLVSGCFTVTSHYRDGELESRSWTLGAPPEPQIDGATVVVKRQVYGLAAGRNGLLVGYDAGEYVFVSQACFVYLEVRDPAHAAALEKRYGEFATICIEGEPK